MNLDLIEKNYRPVSNLSFVSKLTECAAIGQLVKYNDTNGTTPKHQSACTEKHSCETALIKLVNDILWNMENKKLTALVFLDLSAAFDTVDHRILLDKLNKSFGVQGMNGFELV